MPGPAKRSEPSLSEECCINTLTLALGQKNSEYQLSFSHWREFDAAEAARQLIGLAAGRLGAYRDKADFLASKRYRRDTLDEYFEQVFEAPAAPRSRPAGRRSIPHNALLASRIVETQPGYYFAPGTWWNAFNAVTYLTGHKIGKSADTRLNSAWYDRGKTRKLRALELALEFAKAA